MLSLNEWTLAILIIGGFVLLSCVCLWATGRFIPGLRFGKGSTDFGLIYGTAIGTIFALIFTFDIISAWQNHEHVAAQVSQEAANLNNIYQDLDAYPPEIRDPLQSEMRSYVEKVVGTEWALQAKGDDEQDPGTRGTMLDIYGHLTRYRPGTGAAEPLHEAMLDLVSENRTLRLERIKGGEAYLDGMMWLSLGLGAVILIGFSCLLNMASRTGHYTMHASLAFSIGLVCYMLLVYDYPYLGPGAVKPGPLRELTEKVWVAR